MLRSLIFFCVAPLLFSGCALLPQSEDNPEQVTVEHLINDPEFAKTIQPIRTVTVLVFSGGHYSKEDTENTIQETSKLLTEQVGIELKIVHSEHRNWKNATFLGVYWEMLKLKRYHPEADIAIGFFSYRDDDPYLSERTPTVGMALLWPDIAMRTNDYQVLAHEIGHVFMPERFGFHDTRGVMHPYTQGRYYTIRSWKIMLRNKWLEFRSPKNSKD